MSKVRVGINGFGRMGRLALRAAWGRDDMEFVAINEPSGSPEALATLLEFDSVQGRFGEACTATESELRCGGQAMALWRNEHPGELPWDDLGVDLVLECSGQFRTKESTGQHLGGSVQRVVVSVPVTGGPPNIVIGVNDGQPGLAQQPIVTAASCTTNCLGPVAKVLHERFGIVGGLMTTVHAYTNDQRILDLPHSDLRRARAAAENIIPTITGAARAVGQVLPKLAGKLDGCSMRVPVKDGSVVDLVVETKRPVSIEAVNAAMKEAARGEMKGVLEYSEDALVSSDIIGNPHSSIFDAGCTMVMGKRMLKIVSWYDNEWGYSNRVVELMKKAHKMKAPAKKAKKVAKKAKAVKAAK